MNIVGLCKDNNIKLINVFPPNFKSLDTSFVARIKDLNPDSNWFQYDQNNSIYTNKDYFHDEGHLTKEGAIILSEELSVFISGHE